MSPARIICPLLLAIAENAGRFSVCELCGLGGSAVN